MALAIELGIAKVNKYASRESGDTAEVVERPGGGVSVVIVDGQGSGAAAKALSLLLSAKAVSLLKEGVRDGAVARAVHDTLLTYRGGKVSAGLDIISTDFKHRHLVITRNGTTPLVVMNGEETTVAAAAEGPIGIYPFTRPCVLRLPLEPGVQVWAVTDGIVGAGVRWGEAPFALEEAILPIADSELNANEQAQRLLECAMRADRGRPSDDMTVATLKVVEQKVEPGIRTLHLFLPTS
jgi:serine phosphatase RsbU (regulator of sigma subunit)